MKRIVAWLLCIFLLLPLAACSQKDTVKENNGYEKTDYRKYSAEELYSAALEKTTALTSASFLTEVSEGDEELYTVETRRIREGYDGFSYSREGLENVYFNDRVLYLECDLGNFSAESTDRNAQSYLDTYHCALYDLPLEALTSVAKEDLTLSFTLTDPAKLALYAEAYPADRGSFVPTGLTGVAAVSEDGLLEKVQYTVSGTLDDGSEVTLKLETALEAYRTESIRAAIPGEDYVAIGDLRIPHLLESATASLQALPALQATLLSSESLTTPAGTFASHLEENFYQKENGDYYLSRQSRKSAPEAAEQSLFYQVLQEGEEKKENEYDVLTGTLLSENTAQKTVSPWEELLEGYLSALFSLSSLSLTEDTQSISISFEVGAAGVTAFGEKLLAAFPESGASLSSLTGEGSGVFTLSAKTGILTAFALSFGGTAEENAVSCQYSVTLDTTESVDLPALQTPSATTPGMADENEPIPQ